MKKHIIITKKIWDKNNFKIIKNKNFKIFTQINLKNINKIKPDIIFFIHWSKFINKNLYEKYNCIQFHCSDLPKFRGGSPIQNQIMNGIKITKITAFKVTKKLDAGEYCKKKIISLDGKVSDILKRIEKYSIKMILDIIRTKKIKFKKQNGKVSSFKRRSTKDSDFSSFKFKKIRDLYDFIRMLDGEGYPNAYLFLQKYKIIFKNAKLTKKKIIGDFKIEKKFVSSRSSSR